MKKAFSLFVTMLFLLPQLSAARVTAQRDEPDWKKTGDEAVSLLADYLRVDTINPPGNEARATEFFGRVLKREGIEYQIFESAPGRANLYARLRGNGRKRPLILLNHTDVVPADKEFWSSDPLSGEIRNGYIYGRGALDMKSTGLAQLIMMLLLKRSGVALDRDVIFLAPADEEAGGRAGAGWMAKNRAELVRDAEFLLTEGGSNMVLGNKVLYYGVGVTEKTPCWLRLTAKGTPGHGSVPRSESAPSRLIRALGKLEAHQTELKVTPAVAKFFSSIAELQSNDELKRAYSDIASAIRDSKLRNLVLSNPQNSAMLRNTIQPTVVQVGNKTNVIAPVARAEIDCRLLPGQKPEDFVAEIKRVINDPGIEVETLLAFSNTESSMDSDLYRSITSVISAQDRSAKFVPTVLAGFTDSHFFRDMGVVCYGFSPFLISSSDYSGVHGNDERIPEQSFRDGLRLFYKIVHNLCGAQP
jgi:acetylornithine deacetylase/succinyl-diaminopimelate desuccinylase-like protein